MTIKSKINIEMFRKSGYTLRTVCLWLLGNAYPAVSARINAGDYKL